ncbi:MAG: hypothetical protein JST82_14555 [Bacteroidetes bacterium]|nr:hypothetical protein [Bacteroidota bacterium]
MRKLFLLLVIVTSVTNAYARFHIPKPMLTGVYLQWGYNRDIYSKSDLHFKNGSQYDFTIHKAKAHDQPDFSGFWTNPIDITIPQNVYRIGFYLNKKRTHSIEINFDHAKYVVADSQKVRVSGRIGNETFDRSDTTLYPWFVHLEHTNGANFYFINYVGHYELLRNTKKNYRRASAVWKAGAGIVVPKSDIILMGRHLDNKYHVAGYVAALEGGLRIYPFKNFFFEATGKGGFANYLNALTVGDGGRINHHFWFGEVIGTFGFDINLNKKRLQRQEHKTAP